MSRKNENATNQNSTSPGKSVHYWKLERIVNAWPNLSTYSVDLVIASMGIRSRNHASRSYANEQLGKTGLAAFIQTSNLDGLMRKDVCELTDDQYRRLIRWCGTGWSGICCSWPLRCQGHAVHQGRAGGEDGIHLLAQYDLDLDRLVAD